MIPSLRSWLDFDFNLPVARAVLRHCYQTGQVYRVPFGPLRGMRMAYHPEMNIHTILGLADLSVFRLLTKVLQQAFKDKKNLVAVDLGANRGIYSLWLSQLGYFSTIHSFEPNPNLAHEIEKNIELNSARTIHLEEVACANGEGTVDLVLNGSDSTSSIVATGTETKRLSVKTTSLDLYFENRPAPHFVKMDIEGAGTLALPHAKKCFSKTRPILYLESHSTDEDNAIGKLLRDLDYQAYRTQDRKWVEKLDCVYPNPQGIFGNIIACPIELRGLLAPIM